MTSLWPSVQFGSHLHASTSRPCASSHRVAPGLLPKARKPCMTCRVTNTSEEIYKAEGISLQAEDEDITVNDIQVLYPELGSLEGRVSKFYLDELFANTGPDLEETAYWFHTPAEGWKREPTRFKAAQEAPVTFADPTHEAWQQEGRTSLDELQEGQVITGTISDIWLYHGCQIDFGYQYDGLIPMFQDQWLEPGVREALMPGDQVVARVFKVRQPGLYRWPIQLEMIEPVAMASHMMDAEEYQAPINHAWAVDQGWGMEEILAATGRDYEPSNYIIPQDQAALGNEMQKAYGYDVENEEAMDLTNPMEDRVSLEYVQQISHLALQGNIFS